MDLLAGYDSDSSGSGNELATAPESSRVVPSSANQYAFRSNISLAPDIPAPSAAPSSRRPIINTAPSTSPAPPRQRLPGPSDIVPGPQIPLKVRKEMDMKSKGIDDIPAPEDAELWSQVPAPSAAATKRVVKLQLPFQRQLLERVQQAGNVSSDSDEEEGRPRKKGGGAGAAGPLSWLPPPKSGGALPGGGAAGARLDVGPARRAAPRGGSKRKRAGSDSDDDGALRGEDLPDLRNIHEQGGIADADFDPSAAQADLAGLAAGAGAYDAVQQQQQQQPATSSAPLHPSMQYAVAPQAGEYAAAYGGSDYAAYAAQQQQQQQYQQYYQQQQQAPAVLQQALLEEQLRAARRGGNLGAGIQFTEVNQQVRRGDQDALEALLVLP